MNKIKRYISYLIYKQKCKRRDTILNTYNFGENIKIGKNCIIAKKVLMENNITIGDCTYISANTAIYSDVNIGKFCSIASNVYIAPGEHDITNISTHPIMYNKIWRKMIGIEERESFQENIGNIEKVTNIGNDVWIALNVFIKRGVQIGDGAVIGAGSVVTKDVEPYSVVAGNPAKVIKYRFSKEEINFLEKKRWWDMSYQEISKQLLYMYDINKFIKKEK